MASNQTKKTGKNRKYGRNATCCNRYELENRRERNKLRRMKRHVRKYPNDTQTMSALLKLRAA